MALKEKSSGRYVKINLEGCYIDINGTHVMVTNYVNEEERSKEKLRSLEIDKFRIVAQDEINNLYGQLCEEYRAFIDAHKDISIEEMEKILPKDLRDMGDMVQELNNDLSKIIDMCFVYEGTELDDKSLSNKQFFENIGLKEEWLSDPVIMRGQCIISCSKSVTGKSITSACMYNELKKVLKKEDYQDC